jgi:site-specific DNA-methyltransferase (adenine-specific)
MLNDDRLRIIIDYPDSNEVFPGTQIKGGVSFFLWDRDNRGKVSVSTIQAGKLASQATRDLLEPGADVFIRYNEAVSILQKVFSIAKNDTEGSISFELPPAKRFESLVSSIGAFGLDTTFRGKDSPEKDDVKVYRNGGVGYLPRAEISKERHVIDKWKVFIPAAGSGSDSFPHSILGKPFIGEPGSISSWTYLYIGPFESKKEAENVIRYISTRLFRFLVLQHKSTQHATKTVYTFVPTEDWKSSVTDELLYAKYGITDHEISFIESMIRPMEIEIV